MRFLGYTKLMLLATSLCFSLITISSFSVDLSYESSPEKGVKSHLSILSNKALPKILEDEL